MYPTSTPLKGRASSHGVSFPALSVSVCLSLGNRSLAQQTGADDGTELFQKCTGDKFSSSYKTLSPAEPKGLCLCGADILCVLWPQGAPLPLSHGDILHSHCSIHLAA